MGIKETSIGVTTKMNAEGVSYRVTNTKVKGKYMIFEEKGLEELVIKKAIFEVMGKMIYEVTCIETLGKKVDLVKDMAKFFEVKGEATFFEVMDKRLLEEVGKLFNEVVCLKLMDIEEVSFEVKSRLILEVVHFVAQEEKGIEERTVEEMSMMMNMGKKGLELNNEALSKEMINEEEKGQDELWRSWGRLPRS